MQSGHDSQHDEQAERWLVRLQAEDCGAAERAAFERWRNAGPAQAAAYQRAEGLHQRSASLRGDPVLQAAARTARIHTARAREHRIAWRRGLSWAAAASLLLVVGGVGWHGWNPAAPEQHHATAVGEKRSLQLDDGSTVLLDTDSIIRVQYRRRQRDVVLEQGQAQFTVARQPSRPFTVHTRGGSTRALGTRFQVRAYPGSARITLLEGRVRVTAPGSRGSAPQTTLEAGEQVSYAIEGLGRPQAADLEMAQGWTQGELVFQNRPLREIVEEMNRHTRVKLRLGDRSLEGLLVSGVFYDNNQASLIRALEYGWSLRAVPGGDGELVLSRRE